MQFFNCFLVPGEKPLGAEERTNKLNLPVTPSMESNLSHKIWWDASALTTVPSLFPLQAFHSKSTNLLTNKYKEYNLFGNLEHNDQVADLSLAFSSGIPIEISLSNRPARRRAGSSESGRLVAPITSTRASGSLLRSVKSEI